MAATQTMPDRTQDVVAVAQPPIQVSDSSALQSQALAGDAKAAEELITAFNKNGMASLRAGQHDQAFEQFKYAEALLLSNPKVSDSVHLLAMTCNNLGCYYKKVGKYHGALSYLRKALAMEVELNSDGVTLAGTHLNLCAILSKLEKHDRAVQHALSALELMRQRVEQSEAGVSQDEYAVLAIAYHNLATEREFLQEWDQAATAFQTGHQVAKRLLGENHALSITLHQNCDTVLKKARSAKAKQKGGVRHSTMVVQEDLSGHEGSVLPEIVAVSKSSPEIPMTSRIQGVRHEAADWVRSEEALWQNFAQETLRGTTVAQKDLPTESPAPTDETKEEPVVSLRPQPLTAKALSEMQENSLGAIMPKTHDMGAFKFVKKHDRLVLKKTPLGQALGDYPEALMDIVDVARQGRASLFSTANDFRPNRSMKRSTRTSMVVRAAGTINSTLHRDHASEDIERKRLLREMPWRSAQSQNRAATRIQTIWRKWHQYCQDNSEWMTITWICAAMIQSHWRSYHARRQRMDFMAKIVQRHCRGFLVRCTMRSHLAAATIQRHTLGMLTRMKLRQAHEATTHIQRLVRGGLARKHFREFRTFKTRHIVVIQTYWRVQLAIKETGRRRGEAHDRALMLMACIYMQKYWRGWKARDRVSKLMVEREEVRQKDRAARKVQGLYRRRQAKREVERLRKEHMKELEKAATFVRKMWLGAQTKRQYNELKDEFQLSGREIVTIQRYVRGCMCRIRLWKEAVRVEEELWAAVEIQRSWRGYRGRVLYEDQYELMWLRETSAAMIQRNARGFLARTQTRRRRRTIARAEFERARARFRAAQRIQALARGVQRRKVTNARKAKVLRAATQIQRITRGHSLRVNMWRHIVDQRATLINAAAKGFLVRQRQLRLLANVLVIQRFYRKWRRRESEEREEKCQHRAHRKAKAIHIQRHYRDFARRKDIKRFQASTAEAFRSELAELQGRPSA